MPVLDPAVDFVQLPVDSTGKKSGFKKIGTLYVAASVGVTSAGDELPADAVFGLGMDMKRDSFADGQVLAQQSGADGVLTFTFASAVELILVESSGDGLVSRCDPWGGTPTSTLGWPIRHEVPTYLPARTSSVKVFAPAGTTVNVMGMRR